MDTDGDSLADEIFTSEFDANDRLLRELIDDDGTAGVDRTVTHAYDRTQAAGKTVWQGTDTSEATGVTQSRTTHSYDLQGRLSQVLIEEFTGGAASSRTRLSYRYDPQGIRITALEETDAAADGTYETRRETRYLVDHDNATGYAQTFAETVVNADTGAILSKTVYVVGHDELTQTRYEYDASGAVTSETTHTFTHDGHGSVRVLLDAAAAIAQVYTYAAYGQLLAIHSAGGQLVGTTADAALTSYLYTGEYFDARSGLEYLRARWYDPATGRFNRLDPFAGNLNDPLSLHKYLYCFADAVNLIDVLGLWTLCETLGTLRTGAQKVAAQAWAAWEAYDKVDTAKETLILLSNLVRGRPWDPISALLILAEFLPLGKLASRVKGFVFKIPPGTKGIINESIDHGSDVLDELSTAYRKVGGNGAKDAAEFLGVHATVLVASAKGLKASPFKAGYHGIDGLMLDDAGKWVLVEAKGASSTLGTSVAGYQQLSRQWIKDKIQRIINAEQNIDVPQHLKDQLKEALRAGEIRAVLVHASTSADGSVEAVEFLEKTWDQIGDTLW